MLVAGSVAWSGWTTQVQSAVAALPGLGAMSNAVAMTGVPAGDAMPISMGMSGGEGILGDDGSRWREFACDAVVA